MAKQQIEKISKSIGGVIRYCFNDSNTGEMISVSTSYGSDCRQCAQGKRNGGAVRRARGEL